MEKLKMKEKFYECISKNVQKSNSFLMDTVKYNKLIEDVKLGKTVKKENRHYYLLLHYDVITVGGKEYLIMPKVNDQILFYVTTEELFDILYDTHESTGHGGRDRMRKELKQRYKNITLNEIQTFINLCETCLQKRKSAKKDSVIKPTDFQHDTCRCQVDLIDYQSKADREFKFIMVYQDHTTKFVILRALRTQTAQEIAEQVLDIFLLFGAPSILQSNNGLQFCKGIIEVLKVMWPELKIMNGTVGSSVDCTNQEIENMLINWMKDNNCNSWSKGLPFVQFMKNKALNFDLKKSPFEAMFGQPPKFGLVSSTLNKDDVDKINTEEEFERIPYEVKVKEEPVNIIQEEIFLPDTDMLSNDYIFKEETLLESDNHSKTITKYCDICKTEVESDKNICDICSTEYQTEQNLSTQAKRLKHISENLLPEYEIGMTVKMQIPKIDKSSGELCWILAKILKKTEDGFFQLGTDNGVLEGLYSKSQFSVCTDALNSLDVRIAAMQTIGSGQGLTKCLCTKQCSNNRCSCLKRQVLCNSKCHSNLQCNNR